MDEEKLGIEKLKVYVALALELANVVDKIGSEAGAQRYFHIMSLTDEVSAMAGVKFADVKAEFKDLDAAEKTEIGTFVKQKLDLKDDMLEADIEIVLEEMIKIEDSVSNIIKAVKRNLKK